MSENGFAMAEVNLLARYPRAKRNIEKRATAKTAEHVRVSRQYGREYFDGAREYGYGGYRYDGRWIPVAEDIVGHFGLRPGDRVLDIGCTKGFLVKDIMKVCHIILLGPDGRFGIAHNTPAMAWGVATEGRIETGLRQ